MTGRFKQTKTVILFCVWLIVTLSTTLRADDSSTDFPEDDFVFEEEPGLLDFSGENWSSRFKGTFDNTSGLHRINDSSLLNPDNALNIVKADNISELIIELDASFWDWTKFYMQNSAEIRYEKRDSDYQEQNNRKINEGHLTFEFGEEITSFLTIGKQRVKWGTGAFWNPVDTINSNKALSDLSKDKEGKIAYRLDMAIPSLSVTTVWIPNADESQYDTRNFARQEGHSMLAGKVYFYIWDSDISIYLSKKDSQPLKTACSFSTVVSDVQIFGEAISWVGESEKLYVNKLSERTNGVDPISTFSYTYPALYSYDTKEGHQYKTLLGFQYTNKNDLTTIGEIYYNHQGFNNTEMREYVEFLSYLKEDYQNDLDSVDRVKQANPSFVTPDLYSRDELLTGGNSLYDFANLRQYYLHLSLSKSHISNKFDLGLDVVMNLDEYCEKGKGSFFSRISFSYTAITNWLFRLYNQTYYGDDESEFGMFYYDTSLFAEIKYYF